MARVEKVISTTLAWWLEPLPSCTNNGKVPDRAKFAIAFQGKFVLQRGKLPYVVPKVLKDFRYCSIH